LKKGGNANAGKGKVVRKGESPAKKGTLLGSRSVAERGEMSLHQTSRLGII